MSTTTILAGAAGTMLALGAVPFVVAGVASPINRARDARRHAAQTAHDDARTADLIAQIRIGSNFTALVGPDPDELASAAVDVAAELADWFARDGNPEDALLARRLLAELLAIRGTEPVATSQTTAMPPIQAAAALQLLLRRLHETCDGLAQIRVSIAAGALAEAIRALPDGAAVDFNPLGEFDPEPLRRAQTEWMATAKQAGMDGWIRAVHA